MIKVNFWLTDLAGRCRPGQREVQCFEESQGRTDLFATAFDQGVHVISPNQLLQSYNPSAQNSGINTDTKRRVANIRRVCSLPDLWPWCGGALDVLHCCDNIDGLHVLSQHEVSYLKLASMFCFVSEGWYRQHLAQTSIHISEFWVHIWIYIYIIYL